MMLAMERGGADIIELGVPFSDPIADGPTIQESNTVSPQQCLTRSNLTVRGTSMQIALQQDVQLPHVFGMIREARKQGLKTPVLLMGGFSLRSVVPPRC